LPQQLKMALVLILLSRIIRKLGENSLLADTQKFGIRPLLEIAEFMSKEHIYETTLVWTGNLGDGTRNYTGYSRAHEISIEGKPTIVGSSDPHFRGDPARYNPEELLLAALSACHMLSYLHQCAVAKIVVVDYHASATGKMVETPDGGGHFTEVVLRPRVMVSKDSDVEKAQELHHKAHELCFIANSVNFPVRAEAEISIEKSSTAGD
jgi:organic hydroperoxide reductase OsmC/OhrA